jgi:hypothetical protein
VHCFFPGRWVITLARPFIASCVVLAALGMLESTEEPGTIRDLPIKWADVRREAKTLTEQGRML